jgi:glucose-6-phosphate dehydrogenase assembly protein OpcA
MANPVEVDCWDAQGVRLTDIVEALADLRHQSVSKNAIRTAVMTLVAVMPADEQAYAAIRALRFLGRHHPARIVLLRPDPDQVATLDGRAALFAVEVEGHQVNFEEVTLMVGGQAANHLDSLVETFTLADLPVPVWYVGDVPDPADPLLSVATTVLIDSRDAASSGQLRGLLELARRRTVVDLSWIRLGPWRELLSGLFEPAGHRPWLSAIESVEITGKIGPRRLLGGWLTAQLQLLPHQIHLVDARHVEIRVLCRQNGQTALFEVGRGEAQRTVTARALLPAGPEPGPPGRAAPQSIALAQDPLATSLADALTHLEPDPVWERALSAATTLPTD